MEKFKLERKEKVIEFLCHKCKKTKKSKNIAVNVNESNEQICNGCYGELLKKNNIKK